MAWHRSAKLEKAELLRVDIRFTSKRAGVLRLTNSDRGQLGREGLANERDKVANQGFIILPL
jgi:hypothetical protein